MKSTLMISLSLGLGLSALHAEDLVPMPVELPPVLIDGTETPLPDDFPNLEDRSVTKSFESLDKRPKIPASAENVAFGKSVTTSEGLAGEEYLSYPGESGETVFLLTDGYKESNDFNEMLMIGAGQWVQIDLEEKQNIHAIWLLHSHRATRSFIDVVVQTADDAEFTQNVVTVFNNDHDDSLGLGQGSDPHYVDTNVGRFMPAPDGTQGRYVRFYSSGNSFENDKSMYIEAEVYATPGS